MKRSIKKALDISVKEIKSGEYDVVVMDEIVTVLGCSYASMKDVERVINEKPDGLELIMTGRGAPKRLIELADYVTEMKMIKHPFENGVKARKGIEF